MVSANTLVTSANLLRGLLIGWFLPIFTDFYRFFGLSWETSTIKNYHSQDSRDSGSRRIEFSSKSTTFLVFLVSFTSKFADNLGLIAYKLITLFVIFLHVVIQACTCFFLEIPRIEELQDPDSSPRREEVGRRTLRDYGGFLLPFFYRDRFRLLHYSKTSS